MSKILTIFITLGIAIGVFFLYTKPAYDKIQGIKDDVAQFDAALDKARELQELKRSLLARYNTFTSEQLNRLTHLLPDHVDNVRLVLDLDSAAQRYGMAVQNVIINKGAEAANAQPQTVLGSLAAQSVAYDSVTMQFTLRGTYPSFVGFMQDLEAGLRLVDLVALSVEPEAIAKEGEAAQEEPVYRYNVTIRTYWLK